MTSLCDEHIESPIAEAAAVQFDLGARPDPSSLPTLVNRLQQDVALCSSSQLAEVCKNALGALHHLQFNGGERVFPQAAAYWIRRDEALVRRAKLASVLIRMRRDGRLSKGEVQHILDERSAGGSVFASSSALSDGIYIFEAYVAPLLASLSPAVWCFSATRIHGTLLFSYGRAVSGTSGDPGDLLRTLHTVGADAKGERATRYEAFSSPDVATAAIAWWASRLDEMFGVLTDPVVFTDREGAYDPTTALQALLGVEQAFRRTNSLLLAHHDTHARRALAFTVLDTLRSLTAVSLDRMFDHRYAAQTLRGLEERIPEVGQEILLVSARRGVEALRAVQDGFFLRDSDGSVTIADKRATPEAAATAYMGMLRDATHGFTTNRTSAKQREKIAALLAVHSGELSHDVGLVAWLYLLDFMARPERFRSVMRQEARRL